MKFKRFVSLLITSTLLLSGLYAQTTVLSLTSSGKFATMQTWKNQYCYPVTVRITAKGGGGGGSGIKQTFGGVPTLKKGSTGATMVGEFIVNPGEVLRAIAGGVGESANMFSAPGGSYLDSGGGGGGGGSGVVNSSTSTLLILAAGGTGASTFATGIGASAATNGNGAGGDGGTWSTGGGGLNSAGNTSGNNGCAAGGGKVSFTAISPGSPNCSFYSYAGDGAGGMGGGGGAADYGGGGGGHTGGNGGVTLSAAKSYNTGTNQVNTNGQSNTDPNPGSLLIELLNVDEPPTVTCKNTTVYLSASGMASILPADIFESGSDNCGTVNLVSALPNSFTCENIGPHTVTLTVNDGTGSTNSCTATVTVQDNTPPQPVCKNHSVVLDQNGSASITPTDVSQSGSDNCGTFNLISAVPNSFTCTQVGHVTVTLTVNDGNGNTATCTATVTILDNQPPTITCPANIARNTDQNLCSAIATYATPTVSDNCSNWTLTRTGGLASGSAFPLGPNMVEWKVTDPGNNTAICQFTVTVSDAQPPAITCPANIVRSTDAGQCSAVVGYTNPTATDNCGATAVTLHSASNTASGSVFPKGQTTVVWKAADAATPTSNTATCSFTVTVNDNQAPTITCPANQTRSTDANACTATVTYVTPTGTDNCGLPSGQPIWISGGTTPTPSGSNSVSTFPKGQTTVLWRATDAAGLTKTCTFRVTVNDTQAPTFTLCPGSQSLNTDAGLCSAVATYDTPTASDNCTPPTVVKTSGLASGSAFPKGTNTVVWKAVDGAGLTKTCSFTVTVTDAQLPTITCPGNISVAGSGSSCNATVAYANPTATDNCGVQSLSLLSGLASGSNFPQSVTNNVWRAIDNSGGSATCAFTVTVGCGTSPSQPPRWGGDVTAERDIESAIGRSESGYLVSPPSEETGEASPLHRGGWEGPYLRLAPNPAADQVQISIENMGKQGGDLTVTDAQGRTVWQQAAGTEAASPSRLLTVSVLDFPAGLYFVTLRSEGRTVTKRLVVQRL